MKEKSEYDEKAEAFMEKYGWSMDITPIGEEFDKDFDPGHPHMTYKVAIRKKCADGRRRGFTIRFHASMAHPERCTPYDVLSCLQKTDPDTLEDFCATYGYETEGGEPSRSVRRIYAACVKEWENVERLCDTDEELEELGNIW